MAVGEVLYLYLFRYTYLMLPGTEYIIRSDNFEETKPELTLPLNLIVQPEIFYLLELM